MRLSKIQWTVLWFSEPHYGQLWLFESSCQDFSYLFQSYGHEHAGSRFRFGEVVINQIYWCHSFGASIRVCFDSCRKDQIKFGLQILHLFSEFSLQTFGHILLSFVPIVCFVPYQINTVRSFR